MELRPKRLKGGKTQHQFLHFYLHVLTRCTTYRYHRFQGSGFKPKGNFVKKGAPFKGSQPKGDATGKPKGACFNCNEVGHYSKDCPKPKPGSGASKVSALAVNLAQGECNRFIFLKGKVSKREVLCLLDTGASHNFITQESVKRMELPLEELKAPFKVHFADAKL
jgi:hypothetical protein